MRVRSSNFHRPNTRKVVRMEAGEVQHAGRVTKTGLMEIESRRQNGSWLVEVRGEIDFGNIEVLKAELEGQGNHPIVLDLSDVEYMDISGITLLVATAGRLTLRGVSPPVERLIRTCELQTEFKFA